MCPRARAAPWCASRARANPNPNPNPNPHPNPNPNQVRLTRSGWSGGLNTATINALAFVGAGSFLSGGYDAALTRWQLEPAATRDAPELSALTVEELRGLIRRLAGAHGGLRRRGLSEVRWRPEAAMGAGSLRWCLGCRPAWPQGEAARSHRQARRGSPTPAASRRTSFASARRWRGSGSRRRRRRRTRRWTGIRYA